MNMFFNSRIRMVAAALALAGMPACAHINPGQIILSCAGQAVNDAAVRDAVIDALRQDNWRKALDSVVGAIPGATGEIVACVLQSLLMGRTATLGGDTLQARARTYLIEHGYEVK